MIRPIRYYGDPVLRKVAKAVTRFDDELRALADDMRDTLYAYNGVGIAAPQVGESLRVFIALELADPDDAESAETASEHENKDHADKEDADKEIGKDLDSMTADEKRRHWGVVAEHVMVNPVLSEARGTQYGRDGCLSLPGLYVEAMRRDARVRVDFQDLSGRPQSLEAEGHFAHVIQHEVDHLEGVLFFDRLDDDARRAFMDEHRQELGEMQREAKALLRELKREGRVAR